MVLVTHDLDTLAALATRVAVLSDGRLSRQRPLDEIMTVQDPFIERFSTVSAAGPRSPADGRSLMESRSHAIAAGLFAIILSAALVGPVVVLGPPRRHPRRGAGEFRQRQQAQRAGHRALPRHRRRQGGGINLDPADPRNVLVTARIRTDLPITGHPGTPRQPRGLPGWPSSRWTTRRRPPTPLVGEGGSPPAWRLPGAGG